MADPELADRSSGDPFPALVSLAPFTPVQSPVQRRLSSRFSCPAKPVPAARRLAWVSLQGRLVNAEEATSSRSVRGGLGRDEAVAWDLMSPIQRVLVVAVIGVATAESKKNRRILKLAKSVELRDQVLSSMQQKLDNLCDELSNVRDQPRSGVHVSSTKHVELQANEVFGAEQMKFVDCGCWFCDQHCNMSSLLTENSSMKVCGDEVLQYKAPFNNEEHPEERRMSDLSDWASSVTSATEIQMNSVAIDQDICNLKRECDEKDATINELTATLHSSKDANSKRVSDLEEAIRRKTMLITKLRKDMVVLEQKVYQLTRSRRSSTSSSNSKQLPFMADNVIYDMDSTTGPSSSDSDSPRGSRQQTPVPELLELPVKGRDVSSSKNLKPVRALSSLARDTEQHTPKSRPVTPLKEISPNQKSDRASTLRRKQLSAGVDFKRSRRPPQTKSKEATPPQKRWA